MNGSNYKGDGIFRSNPHQQQQHQQPSQSQHLSPSISGSIDRTMSNVSAASAPAKPLRSNLRRNNFHNVQHHSQQQQHHEQRQPAPTGTERISLTSSIRNHLMGSYCSSDTTVVNNSSSFPTCGIGGQPPGLCRPTLSMVSESSVVADKTSTHRPHPQHFSSNGCTPSSSGVDAVRGFVKGFISPFVACIQPDHYQYQHQHQQPKLNPSAAVKRSTTGVSVQHASSFGTYVSHVEAKRADTTTSSNHANGSEKENIIEPNINDVLCGRGNNHNRHPGNVHFRELIAANKLLYCTLTKKEKMLVARQIVNIILHSTDPPGRFLGRDGNTGMWYDIGLPRSLEKTSQALREKVVPATGSATVATSTPTLEYSSSKCDKNNHDDVTDLDEDDDVVDRVDEKTVVAENATSKERQRDLDMSGTKILDSTTGNIKKNRTPNPHITIPNHLQSIYHSQQQQQNLQQQQHHQAHQHTPMSRMYPYPNNYMAHVAPSSVALPPLQPRQPHYHAAPFSAAPRPPPPPPPPPVLGQTGHHYHYPLHPNHSYTPYQQHPATPSHSTNSQKFYYHRQPDGSTPKQAPPIHPLSQAGFYSRTIPENSAPPKQDDYRATTNLYHYPTYDGRSPYKGDRYQAQPVNTPSASGSGALQDLPIVTPGNGESSSRDKVDYRIDEANLDVIRIEQNEKSSSRSVPPTSISRESSPIQQKHWKRQRTIVNGIDQKQGRSNDSNDRDYNNDTDLPGSRIGTPTPSFSDYHKNYNITSEPTQLVQAIETHLSLEDRVVGGNRKQQQQHRSPSFRSVTITMTSTVDDGDDDDDDDRRKDNDQYHASVSMSDENYAKKLLFKDISSPTGLTQGRLRTRLYSNPVTLSGSLNDNDDQEHKYPIDNINYSTSNASSNAFAGNEMDGLAALSTAAFLLQLDECSNS